MIFRQIVNKLVKISARKNINRNITSCTMQNNLSTISNKPLQTRFATIKVCLVVVPFLLVGATISKNAARILEEQEIFVPDEDEDD